MLWKQLMTLRMLPACCEPDCCYQRVLIRPRFPTVTTLRTHSSSVNSWGILEIEHTIINHPLSGFRTWRIVACKYSVPNRVVTPWSVSTEISPHNYQLPGTQRMHRKNAKGSGATKMTSKGIPNTQVTYMNSGAYPRASLISYGTLYYYGIH